MPGTRQSAMPVRGMVTAYQSATIAAGSVPATLTEFVVPFRCQVGAIVVNAQTAGAGAGNTVLDILKNGTSIFATAGNRPTLAAASTGEFQNAIPDGARSLLPGDRLTVQVATSPATNTHGRISASVALNLRG